MLQFDAAMRATAQAMGQVGQSMKSGKKRRKERVLMRRPSFPSSRPRGRRARLIEEHKPKLEEGERHSGYLFKRNTSGSWKKKWCQLKGCIFSYYK